MKMQYKVVEATTVSSLNKKVNDKLEEDWLPVDGARATRGAKNSTYFQTLVKLPD